MTETVNHPKHYNAHASGVECIDIVEWLGFNRGNAVKYLWRKDDKGKSREDTEKALWYVTREIQRRESPFWTIVEGLPDFVADQWIKFLDVEPTGWRSEVMNSIFDGQTKDLEYSARVLRMAIHMGLAD